MSYPAPDSLIHVVVTKWEGKCIIAVDANTNQYIHWLGDDMRWEGAWKHLIGKPELMLLARVGHKDGARGRKFFVMQADVTVAQPKSVTRSPLDLFTATEQNIAPVAAALDDVTDSIERHAPKTPKSRQVTFDPNEVDFLERLQGKTGCKTLKEAATKCVRMAMAYDS